MPLPSTISRTPIMSCPSGRRFSSTGCRRSLPASMRNAFGAAFGAIPLKKIAAETDVPETDIVGLAREFSRAAAPLAFGGGTAVAHTNGTLQLMVIHALNVLAGN